MALDIDGIDADLNDAKDKLAAAIQDEIRKALRQRLRSERLAQLRVTQEMDQVLDGLEERGRQHALDEIRRLGVEPAQAYAERGTVPWLRDLLQAMLGNIRLRLRRETVSIELTRPGRTSEEMLEAVEKKIPGARDAASRLVTGAFTAGLAEIYEQNEELFPCWQYSAVMDGATCERCRRHDGRRFKTLAALYRVLPNFGPNPLCLGDGRCRCRGVPCAPEAAPNEAAPSELVIPNTGRPLDNRQLDEYLRGLDEVIRIRTDRQLAGIQIVPHAPGEDPKTLGSYAHQASTGDPVAILWNLNVDYNLRRLRAASLHHEFWHHIDHWYLGEGVPNLFATDRIAEGQDVGDHDQLIRDLLQAIEGSDQWTLLDYTRQQALDNVQIEKVNYINYMMKPREMTARAFAQWVALRRGDDDTLAEIHDWVSYGHYWNDYDFEEIAAAFDRLVAELGWTP